MIKNLVMGGGGARGYAYISALKALEKYNLLDNLEHIIGTSIGGMIGILKCIGYSGNELEKIFLNFNAGDYEWINEIDIINLPINYGVNPGKGIIHMINIFFKHKQITSEISFKELYNKTSIKISIIGSNIIDNKYEVFNHINTPNMKIVDALRITISIPIYLTPVKYNNKYYVDGGLYNNMAVDIIDPKEYKYTIGLFLEQQFSPRNNITDNKITILDYLFKLFRSLPRNKILIFPEDIYIIKFNPNISTFDFGTSTKKKKECFKYSYNETLKFIADNFLDIIL